MSLVVGPYIYILNYIAAFCPHWLGAAGISNPHTQRSTLK